MACRRSTEAHDLFGAAKAPAVAELGPHRDRDQAADPILRVDQGPALRAGEGRGAAPTFGQPVKFGCCCTGGAGGSATSTSTAPMSHAGPCGRVTPRWSVGSLQLA